MGSPVVPAPVAAPAPVTTPAAPVSTPATPPPAAPETPVAPSVATGDTPVPAAAPAAPYDPKTAPAPPAAGDYPNTTDGQGRFATDMNRWYKEHPDGAPEAVDPAAVAAEGNLDTPKTAEQEAAAEANKEAPPAAAPEIAATPQALTEMMKDVPEFGEFLETDAGKKVKGKLFQTARELAEIAPIRAIVPTVEDAKFMQEYTTNMVGLKTAAMRMIDNPDHAPAFLDLYDSQFARVDPQGMPILGTDGKPTYDADRDTTIKALFDREVQQYNQRFTGEIADLKIKLAGNYPNNSARNADQERLDNLEYATTALGILDQIRDGSFFETGPPEPPADATAEQKAWFEQQKAELDRKHQELDDKQKGASKEERSAKTQQFHSTVRGDMGTVAGGVIGTALKAIVDSGVYIPEFYMQEKYVDPSTGKETATSAIAARLFLQFENELNRPGSRTLMDQAQHELLPQNDQTRETRKAWYARQAAQIMPGLVQKEVDRIQGLISLDTKRQEEMLSKRREIAQPEPSTGGSQLPAQASREQVLKAAEEAAAKDPGFATASPTEKQARIITQVHRLGK